MYRTAEPFACMTEFAVDELGVGKPGRVVEGLVDGAGGLHHLPCVGHDLGRQRVHLRAEDMVLMWEGGMASTGMSRGGGTSVTYA